MGGKSIILIGDGMADWPIPAIATARRSKPRRTEHGLHGGQRRRRYGPGRPERDVPGSDVSNLSILGYDPAVVYTGRSPLEAASIGISLGPDDVAVRCNVVALRTTGPTPRWRISRRVISPPRSGGAPRLSPGGGRRQGSGSTRECRIAT